VLVLVINANSSC